MYPTPEISNPCVASRASPRPRRCVVSTSLRIPCLILLDGVTRRRPYPEFLRHRKEPACFPHLFLNHQPCMSTLTNATPSVCGGVFVRCIHDDTAKLCIKVKPEENCPIVLLLVTVVVVVVVVVVVQGREEYGDRDAAPPGWREGLAGCLVPSWYELAARWDRGGRRWWWR
ncbi:hypothetical protein E2C01_054780 [Portunus trituberculatus]|uniref:Uncharacterized protein n=1 Tax=Portunus trituberculatus TaxID=210409 RepID=A0A5B7GVX7_PORTR|nr:hypothetical protein [Portunus trituberculatus]